MFLQKIEEALRNVPYPSKPEGLYEPIDYVLSMGGKRLRPTLLLMTCALYSDHPEQAMPAAIGIETYHNHTLLHDDLMDRADMRRGKPTVHKRWNDNTAVLSGDTMLIMAFRHIMDCPCRRQADVLRLFARSAQEICEGQQYDVNFETRTDVTEAYQVGGAAVEAAMRGERFPGFCSKSTTGTPARARTRAHSHPASPAPTTATFLSRSGIVLSLDGYTARGEIARKTVKIKKDSETFVTCPFPLHCVKCDYGNERPPETARRSGL